MPILEMNYPENFDYYIHNAEDYETYSSSVEIDECLLTHIPGNERKSER